MHLYIYDIYDIYTYISNLYLVFVIQKSTCLAIGEQDLKFTFFHKQTFATVVPATTPYEIPPYKTTPKYPNCPNCQ